MIEEYPLITIAMTCYNAQGTIESAIQSAIDQDYPNFEIIIYDDYSTDQSVQVIQETIKGHLNIHFIKGTENLGVAAARNKIIEAAKGDFIVMFDDDDYSYPQRVRTQYNKIIQYEEAHQTASIACWCSGVKKYDNGYDVAFQAIGSQDQAPVGKDVIQYQLYMDRNPNVFFGSGTPSCSMMVRKAVIAEVGGFDPSMRRIEDTDLVIRLAQKGTHFIGCSEKLVIQRATAGFDKRPEIAYESEITLINKYKNLFDVPARHSFATDWALLRFYHFKGQKFKALMMVIKLFIKHPIWMWQKFWRIVPQRFSHEKKMRGAFET